MATLAGTMPTLLDASKRFGPDGQPMALAELLAQQNEILMDMPYLEGNLPTGHRVSMRTGLPEVTWRKFNNGVPQSKSTTVTVDEAAGMLEGFGQIDKDVAELNGNTADFRMSENAGYIESMNQNMASTLFYGDTAVNPERYLGLAPRFSSLSGYEAADNVINGGGVSTTNTSIWLVGWGPNTVHGFYPKGSTAGLVHEDLGLDTVSDTNGNKYRAYQDHYQWKCGLAMKDWRYVVRICNVDVALLTKNAATGNDLIDTMTRALERIHSLTGVKPVFYANRTIRSFLRRQTVNKVASSTLSMDNVDGVPVLRFGEVPVRRTDALLNTETALV